MSICDILHTISEKRSVEWDLSYQQAPLTRKSLTLFVGLGQVSLIQVNNEGPLNQNESNEDKISKVKSVFESGSQTERGS